MEWFSELFSFDLAPSDEKTVLTILTEKERASGVLEEPLAVKKEVEASEESDRNVVVAVDAIDEEEKQQRRDVEAQLPERSLLLTEVAAAVADADADRAKAAARATRTAAEDAIVSFRVRSENRGSEN